MPALLDLDHMSWELISVEFFEDFCVGSPFRSSRARRVNSVQGERSAELLQTLPGMEGVNSSIECLIC